MAVEYSIWLGCITYGLTQVIALKRLSSKKYDYKIYMVVFILVFLWRYAAGYYHLGEYIFGFFLSISFVPTLIIAIPIMIYNHKIYASPLALGFLCQIIYVVSDTLALAVARIIVVGGSHLRLVYYILTPVVGFFVSYMVYYLWKTFKKTLLKRDKYAFLFSGIAIIGTSLFIFYFLLLQRYSLRERWLFAIGLATMIFFIFSCLMFMIVYREYFKEKQLTINKREEVDRLMIYAATIEKTYDNMVKLKHDYKNLLIATQHDIDSNNKLNTMLSDVFSVYDTDEITAGLAKVTNVPIKSLLAAKLIDFVNKDVSVSFSVLGDKIEHLYIDDFDAVRMLGILLDNAFEEAAETKEKHISVAAIQEKEKIVFVIENSCRSSLPDSRKFIEKGFSTKSESRGVGLFNFQEIVWKYPICSYCMKYKEHNIFSVELIFQWRV